jgi:hypothetical protein
MEILGWLLIPLAATILGLLWVSWRSRERKPADAERGMEGMARFRQAMERPLPRLDPGHGIEVSDDDSDEPRQAHGAGPAS